jgi:cobalt-zinc-cadmium efflux system protein
MRPLHQHPDADPQWILQIGISLALLIFFLEFFGGLWTRSLALLSDAWHRFIDIWTLVISFLAIFLAKRPVSERQTFGWHRAEVLAALGNGILVFFIAVAILYAAFRRYQHPTPIHNKSLLLVAGIGLLLNGAVAVLFYAPSRHDLNIRGAFLHVLGDALSTLAVIIAALLMWVSHSTRIDSVVSGVIACVVLWSAARLLRDSLNTLLEGVPRHIQVAVVERDILGVDGVVSVHDLHVWSICSHLNALSGHVLLFPERMRDQQNVLEKISRSLKDHFGITHTTIQVESKDWPSVVS